MPFFSNYINFWRTSLVTIIKLVNGCIVRTDHLRKLDYAKLEPADAALKLFLGVYGVG